MLLPKKVFCKVNFVLKDCSKMEKQDSTNQKAQKKLQMIWVGLKHINAGTYKVCVCVIKFGYNLIVI
jgi:hypothetical protein